MSGCEFQSKSQARATALDTPKPREPRKVPLTVKKQYIIRWLYQLTVSVLRGPISPVPSFEVPSRLTLPCHAFGHLFDHVAVQLQNILLLSDMKIKCLNILNVRIASEAHFQMLGQCERLRVNPQFQCQCYRTGFRQQIHILFAPPINVEAKQSEPSSQIRYITHGNR